MLMAYLSRLSAIAGNKINCGPALTWMEVFPNSLFVKNVYLNYLLKKFDINIILISIELQESKKWSIFSSSGRIDM